MPTVSLTALLVLLPAVLLPTRSIAAPNARKPAPAEVARALYRQGVIDYKAGRIRQALAAFEAAAKLVKRTSLLFNIAQCHRKLGQAKQAIGFYNAYLASWQRRSPQKRAPYLDEVEKHLAALTARQRELAKKRDGASTPTSQPTTRPSVAAPVAPAAKKTVAARTKKVVAPANGPRQPSTPKNLLAPPPTPAVGPAPFYKRWWFWTAVVATVAASAAAVAIPLANRGSAAPLSGSLPPGTIELR
jgi:hypothetical protein